jgi:hypothetical protein
MHKNEEDIKDLEGRRKKCQAQRKDVLIREQRDFESYHAQK